MEDKYAQLREFLKNGEFDFGAECCGQPITYTEMIQSLLDERDVLAEELKEQSRLLGIGSEREARLVTERNALRDALEIMVEMVEMNGFGRAYAMKVAKSALEQNLNKVG